MDMVITGAAGFLGSHILFKWLCHHPTARALCLVRRSATETPAQRIRAALDQAAYECASDIPPDALVERITIIDTDITDAAWRDDPTVKAWLAASNGFEVIHGAANLSFREEDRESVWHINVAGTTRFLKALAGCPGMAHFNYISTAYVAGCEEGNIPECLKERPVSFNNVYEESKWAAEQSVSDIANAHHIGFRIFRPSIIIGHSQTYRISSKTGFYKVIDTLVSLSKVQANKSGEIQLPVNRNAGLNLIPIDFVTLEMMDIIAAGPASSGRVYHLTNERPLSLSDLFYGVSPLTGVRLRCGGDGRRPACQLTALVSRGLRHYLPYFRYSRHFERGNVRAFGATRHQADYWLDLTRVREFVEAFMAGEREAQVQPIKVSA